MPGAKLKTAIPSLLRSRNACLWLAIACFLVSRCIYYWIGVRFDAVPMQYYWQIIDPALLRDAFWKSLLYLRTQPPGLSLYVGAVMHLFPRHMEAVFQATYLALGLVLTISLFLLLDRLRVPRTLALLITVACVVSPAVVLYENLLFYEHPITVLFCVSALFLHRYAASRRSGDGLVFFAALAALGMFRAIFNVVWFGTIVALLAYTLPQCRRRTVLCALGPGLLLLAISVKSFVLFGVWIPGSDVLGAQNLVFISTKPLAPGVLSGMVAQGEVSPLLMHDSGLWGDQDLLALVPMPPKTGIAILDRRLKSTGWINMDSSWVADVAKQARRDAFVILRAHPEFVFSSVGQNLERYLLPADVNWPFDGRWRHPNRLVLADWLDLFDLVVDGKLPGHKDPFLTYITVPVMLVFGLLQSIRWLKSAIRRPRSKPQDLTIVFAFGNIIYMGAVVILFSSNDHNRYAFEVFPLYAILMGTLIAFLLRRRAWVSQRVSQGPQS